MLADIVRFSAVDSALGLGVGNIIGGPKSPTHDVADAFAHQAAQFLGVELVLARSTYAGRYALKERFNQRAQVRLDIAVKEVGLHQADAAVDVVADAAGRNHAAFRGISGA